MACGNLQLPLWQPLRAQSPTVPLAKDTWSKAASRWARRRRSTTRRLEPLDDPPLDDPLLEPLDDPLLLDPPLDDLVAELLDDPLLLPLLLPTTIRSSSRRTGFRPILPTSSRCPTTTGCRR